MSRPDVRSSWHELAAAQKPGVGVPFYMRVVNRRLGRGIAAAAHRVGGTPDQMTAISAGLALAAIVVLVAAPQHVLVGVLVAVLLETAFAFDAADGQLARLRGSGSLAGEWLDHTVDAARTTALHMAVAVALVLHTDAHQAWALLGLGFAFVASLRFFAQILAEQLVPDRAQRSSASGRGSALVQLPADVGLINLVFVLWAWTPAFLAVYALFLAANTALLVVSLLRRHRSLVAVS